MLKKELVPEQIITLNDYPVYCDQILKIYFRIINKNCGRILPPCPVIHASTGIPFIKGRSKRILAYNKLLKNFLETHPKAQYFLLDGTHKTTAAALNHKRIPVFVFRTNKDVAVAKKLIEKGDVLSLTTGNTIEQSLEELRRHFFKTMQFQTVAEKTEKLVKNKAVPRYMIQSYRK